MIPLRTDILIVGSGPAGTTAAEYAAEKGVSVTVIERRSKVGVPVRCGEFMPANDEIRDMFPTVGDLDPLFDRIPPELRLRELEGIKLVNPKGKETLLDFSGYTTDRALFDQYLAHRAEKAGAEVITECSFDRIADGKALTSKGEIEYKVIIGADGIAPGAYSWFIPKHGQANVGVGFSPKFADGSVRDYFDKFVSKHGLDIITRVEGKYVPSEGPVPETVSGNGMIVGDAAGHVISVNGGGVPLALIAGRICGRVAADNVLSGRPLTDYQDEWRRHMLKPLKTAAFNKKLADTFAFHTEFTTSMCMAILGKRRMDNLIRCKRIFP